MENLMLNFNYDRMLEEEKMKHLMEMNELEKNNGRKQVFEDISRRYANDKWYESSHPYLRETAQKVLDIVNEKHKDVCDKLTGTLCDIVDRNGKESEDEVFVVYGGNNGHGKWRNYIDEIADLIHELEKRFAMVWMLEMKNDTLDDLFTVVLGIEY